MKFNACQFVGCPRTFLADKPYCAEHSHKQNRPPQIKSGPEPERPTVEEWHESRSFCTCTWMERKAGHYCRACIDGLAAEERTVKEQARAR